MGTGTSVMCAWPRGNFIPKFVILFIYLFIYLFIFLCVNVHVFYVNEQHMICDEDSYFGNIFFKKRIFY